MSNQFFGLYRGTVTENNDPNSAMRIKVLIPDVLGNIESWALPCVPPGVRLVPDIGAIVWVEFEGGDPSYPVWLGTIGASHTKVKTSSNRTIKFSRKTHGLRRSKGRLATYL